MGLLMCEPSWRLKESLENDTAGLLSLAVPPGVPWHPDKFLDQLTLSQPMGADYAHQSK